MLSNVYVVLWSQSQNAFHVETISDMLKQNSKVFVKWSHDFYTNRSIMPDAVYGDFIVLAICKDRDEAVQVSAEFKQQQRKVFDNIRF